MATNGLPVNPQTGKRTYVFSGHGASTDIIVASGRAYMSALNKLLGDRGASTARTSDSVGQRPSAVSLQFASTDSDADRRIP